jgi:hypothetical protein
MVRVGVGAPEVVIALRAALDVDGEVRRVELAEPNVVDDGSTHYHVEVLAEQCMIECEWSLAETRTSNQSAKLILRYAQLCRKPPHRSDEKD